MFVDLERFSQSIVLKRKARIQHTEFDSISTNKKYIYLCIYTHLNMCILYTFQHYIACIIHNIYYIHYKHLEQKKKYQNIKSTYVCEIALLVLSNSVCYTIFLHFQSILHRVYICNQKTLIKLFQSRVVSHQSLQVLTSLYLQGHIYSHPPIILQIPVIFNTSTPKEPFSLVSVPLQVLSPLSFWKTLFHPFTGLLTYCWQFRIHLRCLHLKASLPHHLAFIL